MKLDAVNSTYGAPMGRRDSHHYSEEPFKLHLNTMVMVDGDYDVGGAYWGAPSRERGCMYLAWAEPTETLEGVRCFVRAKSREEAKAKVRETFPNAKFYR